MLDRFLARQFARPHGPAGQLLLGPLLDRVGRPMMDAAFAALAAHAGERVLDLGFGGGHLSRRLLAAGTRVVGVDHAPAMVARARRRHRAALREGRAIFLEGAAEALPLGGSAVDCAASVNTIYFWPEPAAVFAELRRVLAPGGRLVLAFQTPGSVRAWPGHVHGFRAHAAEAVEAALGAAGLAPVLRATARARTVGDYVLLVALRDGR